MKNSFRSLRGFHSSLLEFFNTAFSRNGWWLCAIIFSACLGATTASYASGKFDDGRSRFIGDLQSKYIDTIKYIDSQDTDDAKQSMDAFIEEMHKTNDSFLYVDDKIKNLDPEIQKLWNDFFSQGSGPWRDFSLYGGMVAAKLGKGDFKSELDRFKEAFGRCGDSLNKLAEAFRDYDRKLHDKVLLMDSISNS